MRTPPVLLKFTAKLVLNAIGLGIIGDLVVEGVPAAILDWRDWARGGATEEQLQADALAIVATPDDIYREQVDEVVREVAFEEPACVRDVLRSSLLQFPALAQTWVEVCDVLGLEARSRNAIRELVRIAMIKLAVKDFTDPALAVNWRERRDLAITYGRIKALNVRRQSTGFELWLCVPEGSEVSFDASRQVKVTDRFKGKNAGIVLVSIRTGPEPTLADRELAAWNAGLRAIARTGRGTKTPHRTAHSLLGPWLLAY